MEFRGVTWLQNRGTEDFRVWGSSLCEVHLFIGSSTIQTQKLRHLSAK
jgi:hypothetical protein